MRALKGGAMPRSFHCLMHPLFLDRISEADTGLGEVLHSFGAMVPFSISPVMGRKIKRAILENESYWVRICFRQVELEDVFLDTLERGLWNKPMHLGDISFQVEDVILGRQDGNPWSGRKSYEEMLCDGIVSQKKARLRLASPISFKRGDLHYPLPDPCMIFGNLAKRWNLFSSEKVPEKPICTDVSYSFLDIHTEPYALRKGGSILGTVGKLTFIFQGNEDARRYYQTLLDFAFYSGIGVKTTQGMGMCRII